MIIFKADTTQRADIVLNDASVLRHTLLGEHLVTINVITETYIDWSIGDYILWQGTKYTVYKQPQVNKIKTNHFTANIDFYAPQYDYDSVLYMLDEQTDFDLNGDLNQFLGLIATNMNRIGTGYAASGPATDYKQMSFGGDSCLSALQRVCTEFEMEYSLSADGKTVTVGANLGTATGLTFQYKAGLRNIERKELNDGIFVTRLYPFGSERNIEFSSYGHKRLRIAGVNKYLDNNTGTFGIIEKTKIWDDIYPRRTGTVTSVGTELEFIDTSMDFDLNSFLSPATAKVVFNTGGVAGYEFEIASYDHGTKQFTIIPIEDDQGQILPNATLKPGIGSEYVLADIYMPQTYIDAAEAELESTAQNFLNEYSSPNVVYDIKPDPVYFEANVIQLGVGDLIDITDTDFGITIQTKILSFDQSLANPYRYIIRVGNRAFVSYLSRVLQGVETNTLEIGKNQNQNYVQWLRNRKRLNDLNTIVDSIFDPSGDYFDPTKIKPLSIETAALAVGAKPLNMQFIDLEIEPNYLANENDIRVSACVMVHLTIEDAVRTWNIAANTFTIGDANSRYLYAVVASGVGITTGVWEIDTVAREVDNVGGQYTFLVGIIHAVQSGTRGVSMVYGQTFVNGRFITTGRIQSLDTLNFFDLDDNSFNMGDANAGIDWNVTTANTLTLRGALVQSPGGPTFPVRTWRGNYNAGTTYYQGDEVFYNGSSYLFINATPTAGQTPTPGIYWEYMAEQGAQGIQGDPGQDGADATQYWTWIKYADTPTTGMSDDPTGKEYFGIASNQTSPTESTDYNDYTWALIKGDQGVPGDPGADGTERWTWIKYADDINGTGISDDPTGKDYIGLAANQTSPTESNNPLDYTWSLYKGPQGIQGNPGVDGADGIDGSPGLDGENAMSYIPASVWPALIGGTSDYIITLNSNSSGGAVDGAVRIRGTRLVSPDGSVITGAFDTEQYSVYGVTTAGVLFLVYSASPVATRFSQGTGMTNNNFYFAHWDSVGSSWRLITNNGDVGAIGFVATDIFCAAIEAKATTGGFTGVEIFLGGAIGLTTIQNYYIEEFAQRTIEELEGDWETANGTGELAFDTANTEVGNQALLIGGTSGNDERTLIMRKRFPYDPTALYKIKFKVERVTGIGTFFAGVSGYDKNGLRRNVVGLTVLADQHYVATDDTQTGQLVVTDYIGYFRGLSNAGAGVVGIPSSDPTEPSPLYSTVVSFSPMMTANYNGLTGQYRVHSVELEKVPEGTVSVPSGAWSNTRTYYTGEQVTYNGQIYIALQTTTNNNPGTATTYWKLVTKTPAALVYRGDFTSWTSTTFANNAERRDVIKYNSAYYIYQGTDGATNSVYVSANWQAFGASFESVATHTLLAENAFLADWVITNGRITSQDGATTFYGSEGRILLDGTSVDGDDDKTKITPEGILATSDGLPVDQPTTVYDGSGNPSTTINVGPFAAIVGKTSGTGALVKPLYGVYGRVDNRGDYAWGGGFEGLYVSDRFKSNAEAEFTKGVTFAVRAVTSPVTLSLSDFLVFCKNTFNITLTLPASKATGTTFFIKRCNLSTVTLDGNGSNLYFNNDRGSTEPIRSQGMMLMVVFDGSFWQYSEMFQ